MDYTNNCNNSNKKECHKGRRCKLFKTCEKCNRIRQARLCDITELASRFSPKATYAVVMPYGEAQNQNIVKALKTKLTRRLRRSTDGMLVSVETSANDALHLNLIINSKKTITPRPFQTIVKNLGIEADIFVEGIERKDIRKTTAYALKKQSIPNQDLYKGNTLNLSGNVRTFKEIMQSKRMIHANPLIAITSMNNTLMKFGLEPPTLEQLNTSIFKKSIDNLVFMTSQLKEFDMCYSDTRGLLTAKEFKKIYRKKIGSAKAQITRKAGLMLWDNQYKDLEAGISLKEHLDNNPRLPI